MNHDKFDANDHSKEKVEKRSGNLMTEQMQVEHPDAEQYRSENIKTLGIGEMITEEELRQAEDKIATLEEIVFKGETGVPKPDFTPHQTKETSGAMDTTKSRETTPKTSGNPFLPAHILKQLKQGNHTLLEEIAQSGEALNASTALIRSYKRTAPSNFRSSQTSDEDQDVAKIKADRYKMIDDLVNEYLPLIAADLRRKLKIQLDREKL